MSYSSMPNALVLIDAAVYDVQAVNPNAAEVQFLTSDQDGVEQITKILTSRKPVQTLYIMAQGSSESLQLGSTHLTLFNLDGYGWQLQQWGESLTPDATIILYGCSSAANASFSLSTPFLNRLRLLTGANIITAGHPSGNDTLLFPLVNLPQAAKSSRRFAVNALLPLFLKQYLVAAPQ